MKKMVILGAGESGTGAALLAQAKGYAVFVSDCQVIADTYRKQLRDQGIPFEEGGHTWEKIQDATEVVKSPGISNQLPLVKALQAKNIPIIDEIELASRYTKAFLISITGSNGKSTTTHLTYHLLQQAGLDVDIAGNMGQSFAKKVWAQNRAYYVLELSSFQLEHLQTFKTNIACILNITPDHLDRYDYDMAAYVAAKFHILDNMDVRGTCIYNADDEQLRSKIGTIESHPMWYPISLQTQPQPGAYLANTDLYFSSPRDAFHLPLSSLPLVGKHNYYNAMVAIAAASLVNITPATILAALASFRGLPHRLEWVGHIQGVDFYNDSKATNVASALMALESFTKPVVWIAGGYDKGNDYTLLNNIVQNNVKALICLGKDNRAIRHAFAGIRIPTYETQHMKEAINLGLQLAYPAGVVLLSPACASFDLFKNFEDRGDQFRNIVQEMLAAYQRVTKQC